MVYSTYWPLVTFANCGLYYICTVCTPYLYSHTYYSDILYCKLFVSYNFSFLPHQEANLAVQIFYTILHNKINPQMSPIRNVIWYTLRQLSFPPAKWKCCAAGTRNVICNKVQHQRLCSKRENSSQQMIEWNTASVIHSYSDSSHSQEHEISVVTPKLKNLRCE